MNRRRHRLPIALVVLLCLIAGLGAIKVARDFQRSGEVAAADSLPKKEAIAAENFEELPRAQRSREGENAVRRPALVMEKISPETKATLAACMSWRSDDLPIVVHPDGRRSMNLRGRFKHTSAVVPGPDGEPIVRCFSSADAMDQASSNPPPQSSPASAPNADF